MFGSQIGSRSYSPQSASQRLSSVTKQTLPVGAGSAGLAQSVPEQTHHYMGFKGSIRCTEQAGMQIHECAHKDTQSSWQSTEAEIQKYNPKVLLGDKGNAIQ